MMNNRLYQIREFAERSGVTVRTLHHYDHLGLLKPTLVAESDYRLYGDGDMARLQQIVTLKSLGFPLKQIGEILGGELYDLRSSLRAQRMMMIEERARLGRAIDALERAEQALQGEEEPDPETFKRIIEVVTMENNQERNREHFEKYYTPEQLEQLRQRAEANPELMQRAPQMWAELNADIIAAAGASEDPSSEHAQSLVARRQELINAFTGGDAGIEQSLKRMYSDPGGLPPTMPKPYSDDVAAWIERAVAAGRGGERVRG
jgi:DNA-binding transcriptional MerR regulator